MSNNNSYYKLFVLLISVFIYSSSAAQTMIQTKSELSFFEINNPWVRSFNPTGLAINDIHSLSDLSVTGNTNFGDFINWDQAPKNYSGIITGESYHRINSALSVYGKARYDYLYEKEISGSVFRNQEKVPFNFEEYSDGYNDGINKGNRKFESIMIDGKIAYNLNRFAIGARVNYSQSNLAKLKDLRYINTCMDFRSSLGFTFKISPRSSIGANYNYKRETQSVLFKTFGTTDKIYGVLIDYGLHHGTVEIFGSDGYTRDETPLLTETHSLSSQVGVLLSNNISWYNEFIYSFIGGLFGNSSTSSIHFSNHNGNEIRYYTHIKLIKSKYEHIFCFTAEYFDLENKANIYQINRNEFGNILISYYGNNLTGTKKLFSTVLEYNLFKDIHDSWQRYHNCIVLNFSFQKEESYKYPYRSSNSVNCMKMYNEFNMTFPLKKQNCLTGIAGAGTGTGFGDKNTDISYGDASGKTLDKSTYYLDNEWNYLTSPYLLLSLGIRYTHNIKKKYRLNVFLSYTYVSALNYSHSAREAISFCTGLSF